MLCDSCGDSGGDVGLRFSGVGVRVFWSFGEHHE